MRARPSVLVVEDDPDTLAAIAAVLREADLFAVYVARNGEQALEVADELGFAADVVVVDLQLGLGMRGEYFITTYRERAARPTPIVLVSGQPRIREVGEAIGAAATLPKPFDADGLVRTVATLATR